MKRLILIAVLALVGFAGQAQDNWMNFDNDASAQQYVYDVFNVHPQPPETLIVAYPVDQSRCWDIYYAVPPSEGFGPPQYVYQHRWCEYEFEWQHLTRVRWY